MNPTKKFSESNDDDKKVKDDKKVEDVNTDKKPESFPSIPGFSGHLSNCTITMNFNYGKTV